MGLFDKLGNFLASKSLSMGIAESHAAFLADGCGEFNLNILDCFDANFALQHIVPFIQSYTSDATMNEYNNLIFFNFTYNDTNYNAYIFKHYARVATIGLPPITFPINPNEESQLEDFCNGINKVDPIHQVGFFVDENGQANIIIYRQILFVDSIGNAATLAKVLDELAEFVTGLFDWEKLSDLNRTSFAGILNMPAEDNWKKYAIKRTSLKTAEEILYPTAKEDVMYTFTASCKVLTDNRELKEMKPFQIVGDGAPIRWENICYREGSVKLDDFNFTFYKDYPHMFTFNATFSTPFGKKLNETKLKEICSVFNINPHLTLTKIVYDKSANNETIAKIIMTGLHAGEGNTRTTSDILATMKKLIGWVAVRTGE